MDPFSRPRIKVCCIASVEEAWVAVRHGASALGLVSPMPGVGGPGVIAMERVAEIAARVPPGVASVLLTPAQDAATVVEQQRLSRVNTVQLVHEVPLAELAKMREALPGIGIIQVIHVNGPAAVDEALAAARHAHALLLDSGNPKAPGTPLGGTGRVHDWEVSRRIREAAPVPVWLAGGLNPGNVAEAVRRVRPFGLDVCTGLRDAAGALLPDRLEAFVSAAHAVD